MRKKRILIIALIMATIAGTLISVLSEKNNVEALSKYGSRGSEVRQIQDKLKRWGYYTGNVDGIYGTLTTQAVKSFQRKKRSCSRWNSRKEHIRSNGNIYIQEFIWLIKQSFFRC